MATKQRTDEKIERLARDYGLDMDLFRFTGTPEDNKVFLAMLDHYAKKADIQLPKETYAMDFGCGHFLYGPALTSFLLKHKSASNRLVNLVTADGGLDGNDLVPWPSKEARGLNYAGFLGGLVESPEDIPQMCSSAKFPYLDFVSCFNLGGAGYFLAPGLDYLSVPAKGFTKVMKKGAPLFLTTSHGGQNKDKAVKTLEELGYNIVVNEPNKFANHNMLKLRTMDDLHIIVAKYNPKP